MLPLLALGLLIGVALARAVSNTLRHLEGLLEPRIEQELGRDVKLGRVYFAPPNRLVIENMAVADGHTFRSGTLMQTRRASITFNLLTLLRYRQDPLRALSVIRIEQPELNLTRQESGRWNVAGLLKPSQPKKKQVFAGQVILQDGLLTLRDLDRNAKPLPPLSRLGGINAVINAGRDTVGIHITARDGGAALERLALNGTYQMNEHALRLQTHFTQADIVRWQRAYRVMRAMPARSGKADGQLTINWSAGSKLDIRGSVTSPRVVMTAASLRQPLVATPLRVNINNKRLGLEARGNTGAIPLTLRGDVQLGAAGQNRLDLRINIPRLSASAAQRAFTVWPALPGIVWNQPAAVQARVLGPTRGARVLVDARIPQVQAHGVPIRNLRAAVTYYTATHRATLNQVSAQAAGDTISGHGWLDSARQPAQFSFSGAAQSIDLAQLPLLPKMKKSGRVALRFESSGQVGKMTTISFLRGNDLALGTTRLRHAEAKAVFVTGQPTVAQVQASGIKPAGSQYAAALPDSGSATLTLLPDRVAISAATLSYHGQPIQMNGSVGYAGQLALQLNTTKLPAAAVANALGYSGVRGNLAGNIQVTGVAAQPRINGAVTLTNGQVQKASVARLDTNFALTATRRGEIAFALSGGRWNGFPIDNASGRVALRNQEMTLSALQTRIAGGTLRANGRVRPGNNLDIAVDASKLDLAALSRVAGMNGSFPVGGQADFHGKINGVSTSPMLNGAFTVAQGKLRDFTFEQVRGRLQATPQAITINNLALNRAGGTFTLAGSLEARRGQPLQVDARVHAASVDVAEMLRSLNIALALRGTGQADLQIRGSYPRLTLAGQFSLANAVYADTPLGQISGRLERIGESTRVKQLLLDNGGTHLTATGEINTSGSLALQVKGRQIPLALLSRFTAPTVQLAGQADLDGAVTGALTDPRLQLQVNARAMTLNTLALDAFSGELNYAHGALQAANITTRSGRTAYAIQQLEFRPDQNWLRLAATVSNGDLAHLTQLARGTRFPATSLGRALSAQAAALPKTLRGQFNGSISLNGRLPKPPGAAEFTLSDATLGDAHLAHFSGKAEWTQAHTALRDVALVADNVNATADLTRGPGDWLETRISLRDSRLEALRGLIQHLPPVLTGNSGTAILSRLPEPFTGAVNGSVDLSGQMAALNGTANLTLRQTALGDARFEQATGSLQWKNGALSMRDMGIRAQGIDIGGNFSRSARGDMALALRLKDTDLAAIRDLTRTVTALAPRQTMASVTDTLAELPQPLTGRATGSLELQGKSGALHGKIDVNGTALNLGGTQLAYANITGSWSPAGYSFSRLALSNNECVLTGSLESNAAQQLTAHFATEKARLESLRKLIAGAAFLRHTPSGAKLLARVDALPATLAGTVSGSVDLTGTLKDPSVGLHLDGADLVYGAQKIPSLVATARLRNGIVTVDELTARADGGNLRATGSVALNGPIRLQLTGNDFALDALQPVIGKGRSLSGHLDLTAAVTGTLKSPVATASLQIREAKAAGVPFESVRADNVRIAEGRITLGKVAVAHEKATGYISGYLPFHWRSPNIPANEPLSLTASLPAHDLSYLPSILPAVTEASGNLVSDLSITGTLQNPNMSGTINVADGKVKLAALNSVFTGIDTRLHLQGPRVLFDSFQARSEQGGTLSLKAGSISLAGQKSVDLQLRADNLGFALHDLAALPNFRFTGAADGDLTLTGAITQPVIGGQITLNQAELNLPSSWSVQPKPLKSAFNPAFNLNVRIGEGSWIRRGRTLQAQVTGRTTLQGTLAHPVANGRIVAERGDLHYAGSSFRLQSGGTVAFTYDPPTPATARLDLSAVTRMRVTIPETRERRNYDITLHVTGLVPDVNVAVTSDPPDLPQYRLMAILSHTDQFDLLASGKDVNTVLKSQLADIVSGTVLPQVFEPIEQGLATALGLDEVTFDYGIDRPLRVDARKEIIPRLYLSYNRSMGEGQFLEQSEQWSVTYRVYQRLFLGWKHETVTNTDRLVLEGSFHF